ncbi:MAG: hypothetical protein ACKVOJ_08050 [Sphingomonadaceae bacterium]
MLILLALAFVVGLIAMAWTVSQWGDARSLLIADASAPPEPRVADQPIVVAPPAPVVTLPAAPAGDIEDRIAALDSRLARIDRGASLASQNALRAERLLIAFAARRAIDRGIALGYLEGQLTSHFADSEPRAVNVIIAASRDSATLLRLSTDLEALKPRLIGGAQADDWWSNIEQIVGSLVVVRQAGTRSSTPIDRFAHASSMVAAGRVDVAVEDVAQMPGSASAADWIARARRYIDTNRALDLLEAAALAETPAPPAPAAVPAAPPSGDTF